MYTKKTKLIGAMLVVIMLMQVFCTSITSVVLATEAANNVEITFVDENLYTAIKEAEEVKGKLKSYSNKDKTIIISNENISSITSLNLSKKEIKDLAGLENFTSITKLDLTSNKIKNIDELASLTNLKELSLANNNIEDCTALDSLTNLNKEKLTVGSQDLEKTIIINVEDITNGSFKYSLPQIFSYIKKVKEELGESIDLGSPVIEGEDTYLKGKLNTATINEEIFEVQVNDFKEDYYGYVNISYEYRTLTGLGTKLALRLLVVNDDEKKGIVFEDENLYYAVKANIEGTETNAYTDSKYPIIRDDNDGCIWYDGVLSLVINRHYLYKDIVELDLVNKKIENLEGLQYFVGLSNIDLSNNFISDVSILEELVNKKAEGETDLKAKVKEIYDELVKSINKKEEALGILTYNGRKSAINKIISEIKKYVSGLSEDELDSETKSELNTYFLNEIEADSLISGNSSTGKIENKDNENVKKIINNSEAVIGTNKINKTDEDCIIQIIGDTIEYNIPKSPEDEEGTIELTYQIINYIKNKFGVIQQINNGFAEVDGEFINVNTVLKSAVNEIKKNIEKLEKYINVENLILILPKETINLTEDEIDSLTLEETAKLAEEVVNAFKLAYEKLSEEERKVSGVPTTEIMSSVIYSITDKDNEDYIGNDKYELKDIILEYISYQTNILESHDVLDKVNLGFVVEIYSSQTMAFLDALSSITTVKERKALSIQMLSEFIQAYKEKVFTEDIINLLNLPTQADVEELLKLIEDGDTAYDSASELLTVIDKYKRYQDFLLKNITDYTESQFKNTTSLPYEIAQRLTINIIREYKNEVFGDYPETDSEVVSLNNLITNIETPTTDYDTNNELWNVVETYKEYLDDMVVLYEVNYWSNYNSTGKNFMEYTKEEEYSDYIKAALVEGIRDDDEYNNYIDSKDESQDKKDVVNIIGRVKGVSIDAISTLPKVKVLNLSTNNLIDISKLTNIPTLVELYVSDNIIRDLSTTDFTKFEKLNTLDLSHNRIYETNIGIIPYLKNLNLSYNYIENINGMSLGSFTRLQKINLAGNRIYDVQNIMYNLHLIANYQIDKGLLPIINYSHGNAHIFSTTKVEECGYIVDKDKVNFEDQTIYANVPTKIMQGVEEYVKLPAIFNQVKYIDCGETNFLNAKATNDGMVMYLETSRLGEQTGVAYIQGTGVATGTKCYVTYTVATEEEVNKVLIEGLDIQIERELTNNENDTMPDIDRDGDVDSDDLAILNNTGIKLTEEQMKIAKNIVPDDVYEPSDRVLLKKYIDEKVGWTEKTLTAAMKAKAEDASMTGKNKPSNDDLLILAKYIMSGHTSSYTVDQLLEKLDITGDKQLTALDAMYLTKYLAITSTEKESIETIELKMIGNYKETKQLYAKITPDNADQEQKEIVWRTSNQAAVSVNQQGIITAVGQGNAIITVASTKNSQVYDTIYVTVGEAIDVVDSIVMTEETRSKLARDYYIGETLDLTDCKLEISRISGKTETVDIKPEMVEGFTTENVTTEPIHVKVKFEGQETGFNMNVLNWPDNRATLTKDNFDEYLNVTKPEDAVYNGTEYSAEVVADENKKLGTITVKYTDEAGNTVEKPVNAGIYKVLVDVTDGIDVNPATDVEVGTFTIGQADLPDEQRPSIATEYTVERGESFTVAVENGIVTMPEGTTFNETGIKDVTLTFVPNNTNYKAIEIPVKVNVVVFVEGISIDKSEVTITKGEESNIKLNATVMPSDATNKNVTWKSSDETIVTVDNSGNVKAVGVGTATITVTTKDGEKTATCKVTVKEMVYDIKDGYIANISPDTTNNKFFENLNSSKTYTIVKTDETREVIATGDKLVDETGKEIATLVVKGDIDGDGEVDGADAAAIIYHVNGKQEITDSIKQKAADINGAGIDMTDWTRIIYHYIGINGYIL